MVSACSDLVPEDGLFQEHRELVCRGGLRTMRFLSIRARGQPPWTSSGVPWNAVMADIQRFRVCGCLEEAGNHRRYVDLEVRASAHTAGRRASCSRAQACPVHAGATPWYMESAARDAAIRSDSQVRHSACSHTSSAGRDPRLAPVSADSIRLVFASCQPAAARQGARPVSLASSRISRSLSASSCRARRTDGGRRDSHWRTAAISADGSPHGGLAELPYLLESAPRRVRAISGSSDSSCFGGRWPSPGEVRPKRTSRPSRTQKSTHRKVRTSPAASRLGSLPDVLAGWRY